MSIHKECIKEYKCDKCNIEFCDYCRIECDFCEELFSPCPVCDSLYNVVFDDKSEKDMCESCKISLEYDEDLIDYDGEYEIIKIKNIFDHKKP